MKMNRILSGHRYVANFLDAPVRIGMIYKMDDDQFIPVHHFNDIYPDINLAKWTQSGSEAEIRFSAQKEVSVTIGGSATSGIGSSEVKLAFKRSKSVAGSLKDAAIDSLTVGNVTDELIALWKAKGYEKFNTKYIFVYELVTAASGTLIYSEEKNNQVVLRHKFDKPITSFADLGSGEFEYVSNTKRTLEIIRNVAHKPLFKAFYFRKNWDTEILG